MRAGLQRDEARYQQKMREMAEQQARVQQLEAQRRQ
jgi:hypothetical protein